MPYDDRRPGMYHPARWLAVLRIVVGLYFGKALFTKMSLGFLAGIIPYPTVSERWVMVMPKIVARQASENPIGWYKAFLENTVIPNADLFAALTAWGETIVGLSLVFGLCTGVGSVVGLVMVTAYGLATQWMSPGQQGFHIVLWFLMLAFFGARAGRTWGLDGVIARRWPGVVWGRRPVS